MTHTTHTTTKHAITAKFGGKCAACQCTIPRKGECWFTPAHLDILGRTITGKLTHFDGECGREYRVRVLYGSTAVTTRVSAYSAEEARESVMHLLNRKRMQSGTPVECQVFQGNVLVLR